MATWSPQGAGLRAGKKQVMEKMAESTIAEPDK